MQKREWKSQLRYSQWGCKGIYRQEALILMHNIHLSVPFNSSMIVEKLFQIPLVSSNPFVQHTTKDLVEYKIYVCYFWKPTRIALHTVKTTWWLCQVCLLCRLIFNIKSHDNESSINRDKYLIQYPFISSRVTLDNEH